MSNKSNKKKRALVIEDEPTIGRVCRKTLAAIGFDVDIALNGLIAQDMADETVYDLYLSDIRTPAMNGIEFYHYLNKIHPELVSRMIFTTGDVLSDEIRAFLEEYKVRFLPKPFTPEELRKVIEKKQPSCIP
jgi:response regulator RpfG family c-di-GMP phosphodiesterase